MSEFWTNLQEELGKKVYSADRVRKAEIIAENRAKRLYSEMVEKAKSDSELHEVILLVDDELRNISKEAAETNAVNSEPVYEYVWKSLFGEKREFNKVLAQFTADTELGKLRVKKEKSLPLGAKEYVDGKGNVHFVTILNDDKYVASIPFYSDTGDEPAEAKLLYDQLEKNQLSNWPPELKQKVEDSAFGKVNYQENTKGEHVPEVEKSEEFHSKADSDDIKKEAVLPPGGLNATVEEMIHEHEENKKLIAEARKATDRNKEIMDVLEPIFGAIDDRMAEIDGIIYEFQRSEAAAPKYAEAWKLALSKVNAATRAVLEDALEETMGSRVTRKFKLHEPSMASKTAGFLDKIKSLWQKVLGTLDSSIAELKAVMGKSASDEDMKKKAQDYSQMTDEEFDSILAEVVAENASTLLSIPGIYEVVSEYFNNEVLDRWEQQKFSKKSQNIFQPTDFASNPGLIPPETKTDETIGEGKTKKQKSYHTSDEIKRWFGGHVPKKDSIVIDEKGNRWRYVGPAGPDTHEIELVQKEGPNPDTEIGEPSGLQAPEEISEKEQMEIEEAGEMGETPDSGGNPLDLAASENSIKKEAQDPKEPICENCTNFRLGRNFCSFWNVPMDTQDTCDEFSPRGACGIDNFRYTEAPAMSADIGAEGSKDSLTKEALNAADVVGYTTADGGVLCERCAEKAAEEIGDEAYNEYGELDDSEFYPIFADSEWDSYPVCDSCGEIIDDVKLTSEGYEYEKQYHPELKDLYESKKNLKKAKREYFKPYGWDFWESKKDIDGLPTKIVIVSPKTGIKDFEWEISVIDIEEFGVREWQMLERGASKTFNQAKRDAEQALQKYVDEGMDTYAKKAQLDQPALRIIEDFNENPDKVKEKVANMNQDELAHLIDEVNLIEGAEPVKKFLNGLWNEKYSSKRRFSILDRKKKKNKKKPEPEGQKNFYETDAPLAYQTMKPKKDQELQKVKVAMETLTDEPIDDEELAKTTISYLQSEGILSSNIKEISTDDEYVYATFIPGDK